MHCVEPSEVPPDIRDIAREDKVDRFVERKQTDEQRHEQQLQLQLLAVASKPEAVSSATVRMAG